MKTLLSVAVSLLATAALLCGQGTEEPGNPSSGNGPYASSLNDPDNPYDAPIAGFVGPHGAGKARLQSGVDVDGNPIYANTNNYVNPVFKAWGSSVVAYVPAPGVATNWKYAQKTLGPVSGDNFDIASLGDLFNPSSPPPAGTLPPFGGSGSGYSGDPYNTTDGFGFVGIDSPGYITLKFDSAITNGAGTDFAVFENAFTSNYTTPGGSVAGGVFAELAYVEVSTDGVNFARFPSISLTESAVGPYGTIDPTNVYNLAGKSANAYGESWGTPFDLSSIATHALVLDGTVDLLEIHFIRVVDIPGNGFFTDSLGNPIYDAGTTFGSGGFDLDAIGAINVVPEPSSAALIAAAAAVLLARRRIRQLPRECKGWSPAR